MVLSSKSPAPIGDRRIRFRILGDTWRHSWRNSDQTLVSRDGHSKRGGDGLTEDATPKSVHFPDDLVQEIPQDDTDTVISPEEFELRWYQQEDYQKFEKDRVLTSFGFIASKRAGAAQFDDQKYSLRGLENITDERLARRESGERKALRKALKLEEERQKAANTFPDPSAFRCVCQRHTRGSRDRALAQAHEDAKFVRRERKEDNLSHLPRP